jgi:hypothetical protein
MEPIQSLFLTFIDLSRRARVFVEVEVFFIGIN